MDLTRLPEHIAVIMDGNGRWAKQKAQSRTFGHEEGVRSLRKIVETAGKLNIKYLTVYAFSTENWNRPEDEVKVLMSLIVDAIEKELPDLMKNNVCVRTIGDMSRIPSETMESLNTCLEKTKNNTGLTLILALSYSSRWELTEAVKNIAKEVSKGVLQITDINENTLKEHLTTKNIPDPDLLIRTGGEHRISNYLLWQLAYSELYFTNTFWPEFQEEDLYAAIIDFQKRERRFGKISEQL